MAAWSRWMITSSSAVRTPMRTSFGKVVGFLQKFGSSLEIGKLVRAMEIDEASRTIELLKEFQCGAM